MLEGRDPIVEGLFQDALVELQPAQLPVEELAAGFRTEKDLAKSKYVGGYQQALRSPLLGTDGSPGPKGLGV